MNKKVLIGIGAALAVVIVAVLIGTFYMKGELLKGGGGQGGWGGGGGGSPITPEQSPITPEPSPPTFEAPTNTVTTRAEFTAILIRNLTGKKSSELSQYKNCFLDTDGHIYEPYICYARVNNLAQGFTTQGYSGAIFKPEKTITRAEAAKFIVKAFGLALYDVKPLADDFFDLNAWYYVYVNTLIRNKIAATYSSSDGKWKFVYPVFDLTTQTALDWVTKAKAVKK